MGDQIVLDLAEKIREKIGLVTEGFAKLTGFDGPAILNYFHQVVDAVEDVAGDFEGVTSAQKKEAAVIVINDMIDVPYLPEWFEEKAISFALDAIVSTANRFLKGDLSPNPTEGGAADIVGD